MVEFGLLVQEVLSPWNTHLGSEEYEPDAKAHEANPEKSSVTQFARNYYQDDKILGNPYHVWLCSRGID